MIRVLLRRLSPRAEFVLVSSLGLLYVLAGSVDVVWLRMRQVDLTTGYVTGAILIQLAILLAAGAILRARGWDARRLGLDFSWKSAAAGIPVAILYLLLFSITATLVLLVWPAAREAWALRYNVTAPLWLILVYIFTNALFKETAVTAYAITSLSGEGAAVAITASTLLRVAYHLYQGPLVWIGMIPLGLVFAALFWKWRNLWALIVAHSIANTVAFVSGPYRAG